VVTAVDEIRRNIVDASMMALNVSLSLLNARNMVADI
jgi:hypothetical protein